MSFVSNGSRFENTKSYFYHSRYSPVLLSDLVLRQLSLGQIDVSYIKRDGKTRQLVLVECKYSTYPGKSQMTRLRKTQDYLSKVLQIEVKLELNFCQKVQG